MCDGSRVVSTEQIYAFAFMHNCTLVHVVRLFLYTVLYSNDFILLLADNFKNKYMYIVNYTEFVTHNNSCGFLVWQQIFNY